MIDASRTLSICFDDEHDETVMRVVDRLAVEDAIAPAIWAFEVANGLRSGLRRGRITPSDVPRLRRLIGRLPVDVERADVTEATGAVLDLAIGLDLTPYDAAYLELAQRRGVPLATGDQRLRAACLQTGIELVG